MMQYATKWIAYSALLSGLVDGFQLKARQEEVEITTPINSNITSLTPQFFTNLGSKRQKITYGPFEVPSMDIDNGMIDYVLPNITIPCTNCSVLYIEAGLEYPNGTYANANTSLWLHHTVLYNLNATDRVCGNATDPSPERFFASGNERSPVDFSVNGTDSAGYYIAPGTEVAFLVELMNEAMINQTAVVTITFETIPGSPSGFHKIAPIWLDITGCGNSDMPPKSTPQFTYSSPPWTSTVSGRVTAAIGHVHDGGTHLAINSGTSLFCDSVAGYAQSPGYIDAMGTSMNMSLLPSNEMNHMGEHISSMSECTTGSISVGDSLSVEAFYDFTQYTPMVDSDGTLAPVMGIGLLYVSQNETGNGTATASGTGTGSAKSTSSSKSAGATPGPVMGAAGLLGGAVGAVMLLV